MKYCSNCGSKVSNLIPDGDNRLRVVCLRCHTVFYHNPKMVVGAIPLWDGKILLCRRAIDPAKGKWTLPAGYLENGETITECAIRETEEEAGATIVDLIPYAVVNLPHINQVYFMFRSNLLDGTYAAGVESLEVRLVHPNDVPWDDLAFPSIQQVLRMYCQDLSSGLWTFRILDIESHR